MPYERTVDGAHAQAGPSIAALTANRSWLQARRLTPKTQCLSLLPLITASSPVALSDATLQEAESRQETVSTTVSGKHFSIGGCFPPISDIDGKYVQGWGSL